MNDLIRVHKEEQRVREQFEQCEQALVQAFNYYKDELDQAAPDNWRVRRLVEVHPGLKEAACERYSNAVVDIPRERSGSKLETLKTQIEEYYNQVCRMQCCHH